ncbi:hypothetical protein [Stutzerimonas stutzeri]|uniref:hypothetical protein n=1 Tax=Stutzerimonas stutzeri TaxID=316 RepID=UPI00265CE59F|nr:hypothetical protein [Stutzerimonas stutzeri]MCF6783381.1 hypothetical protein [Stutzerimonas stutzeri]
MSRDTSLTQYPLRKPVRTVSGTWRFVGAEEYRDHLKGFREIAERNSAQAHCAEIEVYAIFDDCRLLVASIDPVAVSQGTQIFIPDTPISTVH